MLSERRALNLVGGVKGQGLCAWRALPHRCRCVIACKERADAHMLER